MPLSFISAIFAVSRLAYWLGRLLGAGAAVAVGRGGSSLAPGAGSRSKAAWFGRAVWSLVLLAGTYGVLASISPRLDTLPSVVGSWLVLLLLPRRTPRLFLMVVRLVVMATSISALWSSWNWLAVRWPQATMFEGLFVLCWWGVAAAMLVWAFLALRGTRWHTLAIVRAIPRPVDGHWQGVSGSSERLQAETTHAHLDARLEWSGRSTKVRISALVITDKQTIAGLRDRTS